MFFDDINIYCGIYLPWRIVYNGIILTSSKEAIYTFGNTHGTASEQLSDIEFFDFWKIALRIYLKFPGEYWVL